MGQILRLRDESEQNKARRKSLISSKSPTEISRFNFKFISKVSSNNNQSITWIASNINNPQEMFLIKQSHKYSLYNNKRVNSLLNQLKLLRSIKKDFVCSQYINQPLFAFQDYNYLYLVSPYINGYTFDTVLREHIFTEDQTKYVLMLMIDIIDYLHNEGYIASQLSPKNFIVDRTTGKLKLLELTNPIEIDQYYPSEMVIEPSVWSAPQILLRDKALGQSDYYSLGLVMYQMMKQKQPIQQQSFSSFFNPQNGGLMRNLILNQQISVTKSDLPEGWNPEAADFLVKLLIKNSRLRLGRFGSFEVRNHPWLQNYSNTRLLKNCINNFKNGISSQSQNNSATQIHDKKNIKLQINWGNGINLIEQYFIEKNNIMNSQYNLPDEIFEQLAEKQKLIHDYTFQILFNDYQEHVNFSSK